MRKKKTNNKFLKGGLIGSLFLSLILLYHYMKKIYTPKNTNWWTSINYFKPSEFDDPTLKGSGLKYMNQDLIIKLDKARQNAQTPFFINSGYRNPIYNLTRNGAVKNSAHTVGMASDIDYLPNLTNFFAIFNSLKDVGFIRIGLYYGKSTFIHVDVSQSLPQTNWNYWNGEKITQNEFLNRMKKLI